MSTLSLNTNISALSTQRRLAESTAKLGKSFERLSSGLRIAKAGDDAAGLAISESLRTDSRIFTQGIRNLNDGVSVTNIAESTLSELTNIVTRIQELAEQSANGTLSGKQRSSLDAEAQALAKEYFRVSRVAEFNGLRLFDGSVQNVRFQAGYGESGSLTASLGGKLGTGTLSGTATYLAESRMSLALQMGDLNGDGLLDMVSAGITDAPYDGNAYVRLGQGDGSFGPATVYLTESRTTNAIALADFNGDGLLDMGTAGRGDAGDGWASIRLGNGDGSFCASTSYSSEQTYSGALAVGDLNGDSILDLVTSGAAATDGYATVRLGRGDGTFGQATSYLAEDNVARAVALGDLNGDGILDMITAGQTDSNDGLAHVRFGRGDGTFGQSTVYATESKRSSAIALGDLNGDSISDLVTAGYSDGNDGYATVRLGLGDGTFGQATSYATEDFHSFALSLNDMNGDGALDLVTGGRTDSNDGYVTIQFGRGEGTFDSAVSFRLFQVSAGTESVQAFKVGDVNGDGVPDIVASGLADLGGGNDGIMQVLTGDTREGISPLLPFSLKTKADALQTIPMLSKALTRTSLQRGIIGAVQSRIGTAVSNLQAARENFESAGSQITDIDVASETAFLLKTQITQQAAAAILGQANGAPGLALSLLRNS